LLAGIHKDLAHRAEEQFKATSALFGEDETLRSIKQPFQKNGAQTTNCGQPESSAQQEVIPRKISQITTSQNVENQLRPTSECVGNISNLCMAPSWLEGTVRPHTFQSPSSVAFLPISLPSPLLAGRLQFFIKNWKELTQDPWVLSIIKGYKMTFSSTPHQERISKLVVSREEGLFITEEVQSLKKGVVFKVKDPSLDTRSFYSTLFIVFKKGGERRPIIHLKALNRFIPHVHFMMEVTRSLRELFLPGEFMLKLDLKELPFFQFQYTPLTKGF